MTINKRGKRIVLCGSSCKFRISSVIFNIWLSKLYVGFSLFCHAFFDSLNHNKSTEPQSVNGGAVIHWLSLLLILYRLPVVCPPYGWRLTGHFKIKTNKNYNFCCILSKEKNNMTQCNMFHVYLNSFPLIFFDVISI